MPSDLNINQSTNSTTNSLTLSNLKTGATYEARVIAVTTVGGGTSQQPGPLQNGKPNFLHIAFYSSSKHHNAIMYEKDGWNMRRQLQQLQYISRKTSEIASIPSLARPV
ncbi:hypothetical protein MRX96_036215 [Rhipicephalus microplus]